MKCYYEELGVARDATDADIKSSYRKLALRWHPDKNPDSLEEAKERFQLIQQAYEVLSDPQERCWYDNHREQILRGKNSDYEENCLDVFQYFSVACFKGYGDDAKGFYAVYREVFEKIAAEDAEFLEDEESVLEIPKFGDSQSSYEEVVGPFYAYWQAYCTKKTYTWLCPYDIQEIKDRRVLREIEKEMKKIVQKARKERNEEIRNLVSFIRKRDRRVQAYRRQLEERAALNRHKQEQNRLDQIRRRQREFEQIASQRSEHHNAEYEEQLKQLEQHYGGDSSCEEEYDAEEEEQEEDVDAELPEEVYVADNLYCVACNKTFKNEKAYANHESSKKHRDIVERMKLAMLAEEEAYKDTSGEDNANISSAVEDILTDESDGIENLMPEDDIELTPSSVDNDNVSNGVHKTTNKRNKKSRRSIKSTMPLPIAGEETLEEIHTDEFLKQATAVDNDAENWDKTGKKTKSRNKKQGKKCVETKTAAKEAETSKDAAKAVETDAPTVVRSTPAAIAKSADATATTLHMCVTCKASFPSKNKLFAHLKITNHGVYVPKAKAENAKPKNAKGHRK